MRTIWLETDKWPDFCIDQPVPYDGRVEAKRAMSSDARPLTVASVLR